MKKQSTIGTALYCSVCDSKMMISRKASKKREEGHVKHMYCYKCKEVTAFIEGEKDKNVSFWEEWNK